MQKRNLKGLTLKELEEFFLSIGEKRFRGKQLFEWLYRKEESSFDRMTSFTKSLRDKLNLIAEIGSISLVDSYVSEIDKTTKYLFQLSDGRKIESVLIPPQTAFDDHKAKSEEEQKRLTLCISTQVGCPLNCKFCATGSMGFYRNLTAGEIIDQILQVKKIAKKQITNLVYMGMGEPLLNYDNVMKSIEIITTGMNIAARRITISTVGLAPQIRRIGEERRKFKLAISLHTLDDNKRNQLIPLNKRYPIKDLFDAVNYYYKLVKRRVTFEYILFQGWNDQEEDIKGLIKLAKTIPCKINIIPFHPVEMFSDLKPTPKEDVEKFVQRLREAHVTVFVRSSAGEDIRAACGQLTAIPLQKYSKERFGTLC